MRTEMIFIYGIVRSAVLLYNNVRKFLFFSHNYISFFFLFKVRGIEKDHLQLNSIFRLSAVQ